METGGAEHIFTLPEELIYEPGLIINELACLDYFEEIIFRNDSIQTELWPIAEVIMCENCTQNFQDLNAVGAHLFINPSCFYRFIKQYWYNNTDRKQLCKICEKELLDESVLKKHCFESENCRKAYIDLYFKSVTCDVKSVLESNDVHTREDLLTSHAGFKHGSKSIGCTTTRISEPSEKEPYFSAFTNTEETFQDENSNPSKKVKRTPSMISEVIDKVQNLPALTQTDNFLQCVDIQQPFTNVKAVSTQQEFKPCRTSTPEGTVRHSDSALQKQPLPLKCQKDTDMNQYGDTKFELAGNKERQLAERNNGKRLDKINKGKQLAKRNKGKDQARSAVGQSQVKSVPTVSCLCCGCNFTSQEEKFNHLLVSSSCQLFLKNSFLDGQFLTDSHICDNYTLNKNMCPFCLFTVDDGVVIYHVLNAVKCRNKLEEAISRYKQISKLPTPQLESVPTLACLCCHCNFTSQEEKRNHLFISPSCQLFLKNKFLNGQFLNDTPIYDNYTLNKNMCPFCLFTIDDGDVICHVLNAVKCRNKLEEAISKHSTQSIKLPTLQRETTPPREAQQLRRFKCNICNRGFKTIRTLKCHKTVKHSDYAQNSQQQEKTRQHCPNSNHLFCFSCHKFLKSQADISSHRCRPTRLLSRYWYKQAVWAESKYQCTYCFEKFFYLETDLEKHMYTHEKKTSQLFKFVPSSSNQTERRSLDMTNDISSDTSCHSNSHDTTCETAIEDSSEEFTVDVLKHGETRPSYISTESNKNTFSEPHGLNEPFSFACENCSSKFSLPDGFKAHVMMNSNCLLHYESQGLRHPVIVPFCFKCKMNFKNDSKFINHKCVGLVSILYKCALCASIFYNRNSLSKHENSTHKRSTGLQNVETSQTLNENDIFVDESPVYKCSPCQITFHDLGQFVEHISQVHEKKMIQQ